MLQFGSFGLKVLKQAGPSKRLTYVQHFEDFPLSPYILYVFHSRLPLWLGLQDTLLNLNAVLENVFNIHYCDFIDSWFETCHLIGSVIDSFFLMHCMMTSDICL